MALIGCDISHHNSDYVKRNYPLISGMHFVMMKASEGATWRDPKMEEYVNKFSKTRMGFYHYARPENNNPSEEATNFINQVSRFIGSAMFALDWEGAATSYSMDWAKTWLDRVAYMTGVKPLIYISKSELPKAEAIADADYGLWIADWDRQCKVDERYTPWKVCAMKQYKTTPIDLDLFNGTPEAWDKYIKPEWKK